MPQLAYTKPMTCSSSHPIEYVTYIGVSYSNALKYKCAKLSLSRITMYTLNFGCLHDYYQRKRYKMKLTMPLSHYVT